MIWGLMRLQDNTTKCQTNQERKLSNRSVEEVSRILKLIVEVGEIVSKISNSITTSEGQVATFKTQSKLGETLEDANNAQINSMYKVAILLLKLQGCLRIMKWVAN